MKRQCQMPSHALAHARDKLNKFRCGQFKYLRIVCEERNHENGNRYETIRRLFGLITTNAV